MKKVLKFSLIFSSVLILLGIAIFFINIFDVTTHIRCKNSQRIKNSNYLKNDKYICIEESWRHFDSPEEYIAILENADLNTFEILQSPYARDKEHIYYKEELLQSTDPDTFTILGDRFSKDKNHVYCESKLIQDADPDTFASLSQHYYIDKNYVYYIYRDIVYDYQKCTKITKANVESFVLINDHIHYNAKDKNYVYSGGQIQKNIDPKTLKP